MWDKITRFAGEKLDQAKGAITNELKYAAKQLRDNVVVPAIDSGMEAGVIPADAGMFGRYLTGTKVPLTKVLPDFKNAEAARSSKVISDYENRTKNIDSSQKTLDRLTALKDESIIADEQKIKTLLQQQSASGIDIRNHRMGVGPSQDPTLVQSYIDREKQIQTLQTKWPNTNRLGEDTDLSTKASTYDASGTMLRLQDEIDDFKKHSGNQKPTPQNYNSSGYGGQVLHSDSLTNTLGQYAVKDGVITDRYDFNHYTTPGKFNHGGIMGIKDDNKGLKEKVSSFAGGLADKLGLIEPGHGYDVRIKVR